MLAVADDIFDPFGKNQLPGILNSSFSLSVEQKSTFSSSCVPFTALIKELLASWLGPYSNLTPKTGQ